MNNAALLTTLSWTLVFVVLIIVSGATIVGSIAFWKTQTGAARTFTLALQRANALQMLAVILIVLSASALRILDLINSEGAITLLSGVAGYVLGNASRSNQDPDGE